MSASLVEHDQIIAVLSRLAAAWNAGDGTAYGAEFTEDATYVTFAGQVLRGREAIAATHQFLFDGPLRGSRMSGTGAGEVRMITDDVAYVLVDGAGGIRLEGQEELPDERASTVSFVLRRAADGWAVAAFQNTRVSGGQR
ncbi:SgcJ/EcaC family oxidoreductase [Pseudonocardia sp. CA-107938]|uniref:SgcJ/EcaC family oxidoreductase n=1 Tax=Pseudonocardia sp. CA-107938 TaxID=3240021 RepID=UPI003D8D82CB